MQLHLRMRIGAGLLGWGVATFLMSIPSSLAATGQIYSAAEDGFLEVRDTLPPESPWPQVHPDTNGHWNANVGEWFGPGLTTIVLPFQLPNFGPVTDPFATADLGVQVFEKGSATVTNVDLYGVRVDAAPVIKVEDWYHGASADPAAALIQAGFLTPASDSVGGGAPNNFTSAQGDLALTSFLNASYASGANAGKYAFLRLSYASDSLAAGWDAYKITVREAALLGDAPVITYESEFATVPEPGAAASIGLLTVVAIGGRFRNRRRDGQKSSRGAA